ncbi:hypothetical protein AALO_G00059390 [Alosa alosa]|uniref:Uncharacterized protein n=1 Tax=Alosa alosa TaxID=278164 RepID=A0AAV6H5Y0_9TELE|nr:hypothetical protein AALO_G00059390 [Alosa alosa]
MGCISLYDSNRTLTERRVVSNYKTASMLSAVVRLITKAERHSETRHARKEQGTGQEGARQSPGIFLQLFPPAIEGLLLRIDGCLHCFAKWVFYT